MRTPVIPRKYGFWAEVYKVFLRLRFHLVQRHRYNRLTLERISEVPLVILPEVFNPTLFFSSKFFVQSFSAEWITPGGTVLDLGTGSGVGAVFAARWAARVVAVDVNPAAVRCARLNAILNKVEDRVEVREGDLFSPLAGERFDVVLFNPPYLYGTPKNNLEKAFYSTGLAQHFAEGLDAHLNPGGRALVILSDIAAGFEDAFVQALQEVGFSIEMVCQKTLPNEQLTVYQAMNGLGTKMV